MPQVSKALVQELIEDWINEFGGLSLLLKVRAGGTETMRKLALSDEKLYNTLWWRTTELVDFYALGLINRAEFQEYIEKFQQYVLRDAPSFTLLVDTLHQIVGETVPPSCQNKKPETQSVYIKVAEAAKQAKTRAQ
jgi:hypothetical protein